MAAPRLSADLWVTDDMTVEIATNSDLATVTLVGRSHSILTFFANSGMAQGPERRTADLIVLRDLARKMLIACETALADDRAKASTIGDCEICDHAPSTHPAEAVAP